MSLECVGLAYVFSAHQSPASGQHTSVSSGTQSSDPFHSSLEEQVRPQVTGHTVRNRFDLYSLSCYNSNQRRAGVSVAAVPSRKPAKSS